MLVFRKMLGMYLMDDPLRKQYVVCFYDYSVTFPFQFHTQFQFYPLIVEVTFISRQHYKLQTHVNMISKSQGTYILYLGN